MSQSSNKSSASFPLDSVTSAFTLFSSAITNEQAKKDLLLSIKRGSPEITIPSVAVEQSKSIKKSQFSNGSDVIISRNWTKKVCSDESRSALTKLRTYFLKSFIGCKVRAPLPRCSIECIFWERIYGFYPDNHSSLSRFREFSSEFLHFLMDNQRFSRDYTIWIQQSSDSIVKRFVKEADTSISPYDVKMYADLLLNSMREASICRRAKTEFSEYARFTVNAEAPYVEQVILTHQCSPLCTRLAVTSQITFRNREFLTANFEKIFGESYCEAQTSQGIAKTMSKVQTGPAISKLKSEANSLIENILKNNIHGLCKNCGHEIDLDVKQTTERLALVISQALDRVHELKKDSPDAA